MKAGPILKGFIQFRKLLSVRAIGRSEVKWQLYSEQKIRETSRFRGEPVTSLCPVILEHLEHYFVTVYSVLDVQQRD